MINAVISYLKHSPLATGKSKLYKLFRRQIENMDPVWCQYDGDIHFLADLSDRIQRHVLMYGGYRTERRHKNFMIGRVQPGQVILDIGGHAGYYTLLFAKYTGSTGRVYSFEPNPDNHAILEKNIQRNGFDNVELRREVVSDTSGPLRLYLPHQENTGNGSLYASPDTAFGNIEVQAINPDRFFQDKGIEKIDLIKIDVEGHEENVLRGLAHYLSQPAGTCPEVFVEVNELTLQRAGKTPEQIFQLMDSMDYSAYRIEDGGVAKHVDQPFCDNLIYFKKSGKME
ncbi:MAG: FkbM family methyltransferase [Sedimenticola sp.]|nr:FkbM family methyltransferase [Sedimenticola sp.]